MTLVHRSVSDSTLVKRTGNKIDATLDSLSNIFIEDRQDGDTIVWQNENQRYVTGRSSSGNLSTNLDLLALALSEGSSIYTATGSLFADGYKSLGMLDISNSTNVDTTENSYIKPSSTAEIYQTTVDPNPNTSATAGSQNNNTIRQKIPASAISLSGDRIRLTFKGADTGPANILACYVGHVAPSTNANFDGNQAQVLFNGGSSTATLPTNGTLLSDVINFNLDESRDLILTMAFGNNSTVLYNFSQTGYTYYSKAGNDASTEAATGYTTQNNAVISIDLIQVRTSAGSINNFSVNSEIIPSAIEPSQISGHMRLVPTEETELNVDIFLDLRKNQTDSWTQTELNLSFNDGGTSVLSFGPISLSASGNTPQYRIRSANNKNFRIDGISLEFITE